MKDLGEFLRETRIANGVELEEAADDLNIELIELENIEDGNVRAFRDVLSMKDLVRSYAKYLGLDSEKVLDEFNDFLFEHTSKISLEDILEAEQKREEEEKKIISPYTRVKKRRFGKKTILIAISVFVIFFLIVLLLMELFLPKKPVINTELLTTNHGGDICEYTY